MDAPDATVGTPADAGVATAPFGQAQPSTPAGQVGDVPSRASTAGDRILANVSRNPVRAPADAAPQFTTDPVGAKPSIEIGRPMDTLELQTQVAQLKATTGLAVSATQKSSQGVDTLLKSQ